MDLGEIQSGIQSGEEVSSVESEYECVNNKQASTHQGLNESETENDYQELGGAEQDPGVEVEYMDIR